MTRYYLDFRCGVREDASKMQEAESFVRNLRNCKNPRMRYAFGWSNQPKRLHFSTTVDVKDFLWDHLSGSFDVGVYEAE